MVIDFGLNVSLHLMSPQFLNAGYFAVERVLTLHVYSLFCANGSRQEFTLFHKQFCYPMLFIITEKLRLPVFHGKICNKAYLQKSREHVGQSL